MDGTDAQLTKVFAQASVSLDGYIAGPNGTGFDKLFAWCTAGNVETPSAQPSRSGRCPTTSDRLTYRTNAATAAYLRDLLETTGAIVVGRRLFDATNGWNGSHPLGKPVFVVTHEPPTGWLNTTPTVPDRHGGPQHVHLRHRRRRVRDRPGPRRRRPAQRRRRPRHHVAQALTADLLDELRIDLVPTTLGSGTRFLEGLTTSPAFTDLETITGTGTGVTRLIYQLPDPARSPAHPLTRSPALPLSRSPAS